MKIVETAELSQQQKRELLELWNAEYPANLCYADLEAFGKYLKALVAPWHYLLLDGEQAIKGWMVVFVRENEKWFAMILSSAVQGNGYGSALLSQVKKLEKELNGWVIDHHKDKKRNGETYPSPIEFYKKNGFEVIVSTRLELDIISAVQIRWIKQHQ